MNIPNFDDYTNDELNELSAAVSVEQTRRANLERIPQSMIDQARMYTEGGGNIQDLIVAITPDIPEQTPDSLE